MSEITADQVRENMRAIVREAAEPIAPDDTIKARIRRAARRLGLPFGRAKRLWYGEAAQIVAEEYLNANNKIHHRRMQRAAELRRELETLNKDIEGYGERRAGYLQDASWLMARLAPPAMAPLASADTEEG